MSAREEKVTVRMAGAEVEKLDAIVLEHRKSGLLATRSTVMRSLLEKTKQGKGTVK